MNLDDVKKIRSGYPVPEYRTPLELLIAKEELPPGIVLDAEIVIFMADFAARWPDKWRTVKEKINRCSSVDDLARRLGVNRSTVMRHLKDLRLEAKKYDCGVFVDYEALGKKDNEADGSAKTGAKNDGNKNER